jgi:cell division transport system permease protein
MSVQSLGYHIKEGIKGLFRNRLVNTAAIGLLIACLLVTGSFTLLILNINKVIDDIGSPDEVSVYIDESCSSERIACIGEEILKIPNVSGLSFVSREQGLETLKETYGSLLDGYEDAIRHSYVVKVSDISQIEQTVQQLGDIEGIANINYNSELAQRFLNVRNVIALIGLSFVVILGLFSVFVISNSVRVSAFTRRVEISIMKTVGATNGFIRSSFIAEGLLIGIIGAVVSFFGIWFIYNEVFEPAVEELNFIRAIPFGEFVLPLILVFGAAGSLMGFGGSSLALRRYLHR